MPIILTEADLGHINRMVKDFRHADAVELIAFLNAKIAEQQPPRPEPEKAANVVPLGKAP